MDRLEFFVRIGGRTSELDIRKIAEADLGVVLVGILVFRSPLGSSLVDSPLPAPIFKATQGLVLCSRRRGGRTQGLTLREVKLHLNRLRSRGE